MPDNKKATSSLSEIEFIKALYNFIYTARIHKDNNNQLKTCLVKFREILNSMTIEADLKITIWRESFHFGGEKVQHGRETLNIINTMINYFKNRQIGELKFSVTSKDASPKDLIIFIRILELSKKYKHPLEWLNANLKSYSLPWIKVLKSQDDDHQVSVDDSAKLRQRAKNAYILALDTVQEVADKASKGVAGVLKARRLAQSIVDVINEDRTLILGLATIHEYDDYTYTHSINVSLLASYLGKQLGLSKVALEHLSVCGLFHDLGKVGVPREILLKEGELNDEEWTTMQSHPLLGVKKILRLNADKALRSKIILGPFEHHLNPDMTGYPKTHFMKRLTLIGRILRIVDVYEALTADRKYRQRSFTPNEALRKMWSEGSKSFDPILLKVFIQMMGIFPIDSIVELSNGKFAAVMDYPGGSQNLPSVMLLEGNTEEGWSRGEVINLMNETGMGHSAKISIKNSVIPSSIGVSTAGLFLGES